MEVGRKELLSFAERHSRGVRVTSFADLANGEVLCRLIAAVFPRFRRLRTAPHATNSVTQQSQHNWGEIRKVCVELGIPSALLDRKAISRGDVACCSSALVLLYFLHALVRDSDCSIQFGVEVSPDLTAFVQSPASACALVLGDAMALDDVPEHTRPEIRRLLEAAGLTNETAVTGQDTVRGVPTRGPSVLPRSRSRSRESDTAHPNGNRRQESHRNGHVPSTRKASRTHSAHNTTTDGGGYAPGSSEEESTAALVGAAAAGCSFRTPVNTRRATKRSAPRDAGPQWRSLRTDSDDDAFPAERQDTMAPGTAPVPISGATENVPAEAQGHTTPTQDKALLDQLDEMDADLRRLVAENRELRQAVHDGNDMHQGLLERLQKAESERDAALREVEGCRNANAALEAELAECERRLQSNADTLDGERQVQTVERAELAQRLDAAEAMVRHQRVELEKQQQLQQRRWTAPREAAMGGREEEEEKAESDDLGPRGYQRGSSVAAFRMTSPVRDDARRQSSEGAADLHPHFAAAASSSTSVSPATTMGSHSAFRSPMPIDPFAVAPGSSVSPPTTRARSLATTATTTAASSSPFDASRLPLAQLAANSSSPTAGPTKLVACGASSPTATTQAATPKAGDEWGRKDFHVVVSALRFALVELHRAVGNDCDLSHQLFRQCEELLWELSTIHADLQASTASNRKRLPAGAGAGQYDRGTQPVPDVELLQLRKRIATLDRQLAFREDAAAQSAASARAASDASQRRAVVAEDELASCRRELHSAKADHEEFSRALVLDYEHQVRQLTARLTRSEALVAARSEMCFVYERMGSPRLDPGTRATLQEQCEKLKQECRSLDAEWEASASRHRSGPDLSSFEACVGEELRRHLQSVVQQRDEAQRTLEHVRRELRDRGPVPSLVDGPRYERNPTTGARLLMATSPSSAS